MIKFKVSKRNYFHELLEFKVFNTLEEAKAECSSDNLEFDEFFIISKYEDDNILESIEDIGIITFFGGIQLED